MNRISKFSSHLKRVAWGVGICSTLLSASENLTVLLNEYARKADLSRQTKQEAAGTLIVFTRQDLDRMQIKQLKELLAHIPFLHYKEDNNGLSNPLYTSYAPNPPVEIRLYVNDRALFSPYGGSALQGYAQMDMSYIDHVEIYLGAISLSFGAEQGVYAIKLYTKDPTRENTNVLGAYGGSYGTSNTYTYSAHSAASGWEYLLYADYMDLRRKKYHANGAELSRDKRIGHLYAQVSKGHHRIEAEAFRTKFDHFYANSSRMNPAKGYPYSFATDLYAGYYYHDEARGWKGFVNLTDNKTRFAEKSRSSVGFFSVPVGVWPFRGVRYRFHDLSVDSELRKKAKWGAWESETGLQVRYKRFYVDDVKADGMQMKIPSQEAWETVYALFNETSYEPDANDIFLLSIKATRYDIDDDVNDRNQFFGRLGYIYNSAHWTFKNFVEAGDFIPDLRYLFINVHYFGRKEKLESTKAFACSTQLIRKDGDRKISLFLSASEIQDQLWIFSDLNRPIHPRYDSLDRPTRFYAGWLNYRNRLGDFNTVGGGLWLVRTDDRNNQNWHNDVGGELFHEWARGAWSLHNDLLYRDFNGYETAWKWDAALTWHPNRRWTFYLKGDNILGKGGENRYVAVDPVPLAIGRPPIVTRLYGVDPFDRRVWIGMEYQF